MIFRIFQSFLADGSSSKPLEQYLFPCEQPGPGKMRLAGQFDIWIPRNRLMDIESKHLTGKDWLLGWSLIYKQLCRASLG